MRIKATWAGALLAGALAAAPAQAQITYSTQGSFSGPGSVACGPMGTIVTCTTGPGGFTLTYTGGIFGAPPFPLNGSGLGTNTQFGDFALTVPAVPGSAVTAPDGFTFTLAIIQTSPAGGNGTVAGLMSGTVGYLPCTAGSSVYCASSSLLWHPDITSLDIAGVRYTIDTDNGTGDLNIPANQTKTITGTVVATPEPASLTLLATGLVGIFGAARRRKKLVG